MTEEARITKDIHEFLNGNMDRDAALTLVTKIAESEELIDYLLMKLLEHDSSLT